MFTGIIEEVGLVKGIQKKGKTIQLAIEAKKIMEGLKLGDSISVNGTCLTVTHFGYGTCLFDVMPETVDKTNLNQLTIGSPVNLERAMLFDGRFGGHFVSGHVDGMGTIQQITPYENAVLFTIKVSEELLKYMIPKGSVAVDGISLTIVQLLKEAFTISIIPHTLKETTLGKRKIGDVVNIECDLLGKYLYHFLQTKDEKNEGSDGSSSPLNMEWLRKNGFA
ncbi:riboflavin synthase [Microaerobacter geothermalis]|uniref:riboflavin synthase n=1 Tax=Microaerobacter geothermalis TaxID=674972 RepID=UPI001F02A3EC|nr:riboflavin synthase [Microaerobacter geothermalis]MCF6093481.1 riboflavin synthase [Microaerobacter geothermalis]